MDAIAPAVRDAINAELETIERENNVKIIYACESRSRAWGFPSKNSDYDVRFIYVHPVEWYISIAAKQDVISLQTPDALDINGWDVRKALRLLLHSDAALLEWITSPIIYRVLDTPFTLVKDLRGPAFSPLKATRFYLDQTKSKLTGSKARGTVKIKNYLYAMRAILSAKWIMTQGGQPPIEFGRLLEQSTLPEPLRQEISQLLASNQSGEEVQEVPRSLALDEYILSQHKLIDEVVSKLHQDCTPLNESIIVDAFDKALHYILHHAWS